MKKNIKVYQNGEYVDKEINYIPTRYIFAMLAIILEIAGIIGVMVLLALYVPYFYALIFATEIVSIITIVVSSGNPDYKVAWLFTVVMFPIVGLMIYFIFRKRKLPKKAIKRLNSLSDSYDFNDNNNMIELKAISDMAYSQTVSLCRTANAHLYKNTNLAYYSIGEDLHLAMLEEIKKAEKFIFLEYFIIEEGVFWNSILDVLKEKASQGIEVKVVYDDIGCMGTLPGNYYKKLKKKCNIDCVLFSKLRGSADGEFNNRSHRKILVVDGRVGFTGGVNIADEYINKNDRLGHWKDTGIRLEGKCVNELTKLFLTDFYINKRKHDDVVFNNYYVGEDMPKVENFVIPFGDGPSPIYNYNVGKMAIMNMLNMAKDYVYITTPYLVVDSEMLNAISNCALRGVDVRIIIPHIPDKKFVFNITRDSCNRLIENGVKIYEYTPGFIHSKSYIADDTIGIIGTINLDYRSLVHHFENGVWLYDKNIVGNMKSDYMATIEKSEYINDKKYRINIFTRLLNIIVKLFTPLL